MLPFQEVSGDIMQHELYYQATCLEEGHKGTRQANADPGCIGGLNLALG